MKKTWKKWIAIGMTFSMMVGIAGCGNSKHAGSENTTEAAKKQEAAAPIKIATKLLILFIKKRIMAKC